MDEEEKKEEPKQEQWQSITPEESKKKRERKKKQHEKNGFDLEHKRKLRKSYNAKFRTTEKIQIKYKPLPAQRKFGELIETGKKIVLFLGGRQGGKTVGGAYEAVKQIYKYCRKPQLGWIVSPTYQMSLVTERAFEEAAGFAENGGLIIKKLRGSRTYLLYPPKGSTEPFRVEIKTAENPDRLRGAKVGFIWLDEAAIMSEEVYKILLGCLLASRGIMFITTTPKGVSGWLYKLYEDSKVNPLIGFVKSKSSENKYLGKEELDLLYGQYSEDFARQELEAEFVSFSGLVYRNFNPRKHIVAPLANLPEKAEVICGIDNGYSDPFVCLWIVKHNGLFYVVDEYYEKGRTLESVSRSIKSGRWDKCTVRRWADPSGAQERADLDRYGVSTYPAHNDIFSGVNEVARLIDSGRLRICSNCVHTLSEIGQYHYPDKKEKNSGEVPVDSNNHAMDALRYALYSESGFMSSHSYFTEGSDGKMHEVTGDPDPMSNRLEDWIAVPGYNESYEVQEAID